MRWERLGISQALPNFRRLSLGRGGHLGVVLKGEELVGAFEGLECPVVIASFPIDNVQKPRDQPKLWVEALSSF